MTAGFAAAAEPGSEKAKMGETVILSFTDRQVTVRLNNSPASKDFASMLPMTLTFRDYNATEKISDLPGRLSLTGSPDGHRPATGDFTYYAPWGNLAIFYKNFPYSNGLVRLGVLDADVEVLAELEGECMARISPGE